MSTPALSVHNLSKTFRVPQREPGLKSAIRSLFHRTYTQVPAVRDISFDLAPGEIIGLIGQNGAGKTSTLKLLSGLLHPTSGSALVAGFTPWQRKPAFLRSISMVLGNKSQLIWDIPPLDSFRVLGEIYNIPSAEFKRRVDELVSMLEMQDLLTRPVRNLSLGERMKCELAAGLLHRPQVLFLDEPTLGLDVSIQLRLRAFIAEYNRRFGATVILTSHYMADVAALCPRVVLMHEGRILYDGALNGLAERIAPYKLIRVGIASGSLPANLADVLPRGAELIEQDADHLSLRVPRDAAAGITAALLEKLPVADLSVEDPPIEAVIDRIYQEGL